MDAREPPRPPPPTIMAGPTSYAATNIAPNSSSATIMSPATARFPFSAVPPPQHHPPPGSEPFPPAASAAAYDGPSSPMKSCSLAKKKRGRPRKYSPDGNIALGLAPAPSHVSPPPHAAAGGGAGDSTGTASADGPAKKHRGRPPGSGKKQMDALGAGGVGFTPHVIMVDSGEDITAKLMEFSQQGPRTVCILSANGAVCNVTLRQPALAGGIATYEGRFEIISISGSLQLSEINGERSRTCTLNVTLAGSDGRVLGGGVAGMLTAASNVQIIVGSFIADGKKSSLNALKSGSSSSAPPPQMLTFGAPMTPTSPNSQGPSTESSEEHDHTPFCRAPPGPGLFGNASQPVHNMPMYHHPLWAGQSHQ